MPVSSGVGSSFVLWSLGGRELVADSTERATSKAGPAANPPGSCLPASTRLVKGATADALQPSPARPRSAA
jgi:hypothetical protein